MVRKLLEDFRQGWRDAVSKSGQPGEKIGRPFDRVDGPLYSSPKGYQPDRKAQAIYRERVDRARERKGLPPINWT